MAFSVTCSNCNRSFVDIDESLIGQQARCKCGTIVELDPIWDFDKKANRRPRGNRPAAPTKPAAPAKPVETRKRRSKTASQPTAAPPATDRSPAAKPKKRRQPDQPQPTAAARSKATASQATAPPKTKPEPKIEPLVDNFADLDEILAGGVDHTPLESTRVDSPFVEPPKKPSQLGPAGAFVAGIVGLMTAFTLLITRVASFSGTPLGWTGNALYGTYTASVGTGEMTSTCTSLFIGLGWWMLLLAVAIGVASSLLLLRVVLRATKEAKTLSWSRGLLATLSVLCLFSLLGMLFVQSVHHGNLTYDLDSFSNSAPIEGLLEPAKQEETFQDVRQKYKDESRAFLIGVVTFAILPMICFGGVATSLLFDEK